MNKRGDREPSMRTLRAVHHPRRNCQPLRWLKQDGGTVAISVLAMFVYTGIVSAAFAVVVTIWAKVYTLHTEQREAYWLARSSARSVFQSIRLGTCRPGVTSLVYGTGTVEQSVTAGMVWTVTEAARVGSAVNTVSLTCSPDGNRLLSWQDNRVP